MQPLNRVGIGTMNMCRANEEDAVRLIRSAAETQPVLIDTADFYGNGESEMVIGRALQDIRRENVFVIAKFGVLKHPGGSIYGLDVRPEHIKNYLSHSLTRLGTDHIDVYMPARMDEAVPVEEVVGELGLLVQAGYIRAIGLSQIDAETLKRAEAVHHIAYVESNYSLFNREIESELLPLAAENGTRIAAFGILAHGMLTGRRMDTSSEYMAHIPLFRKENIAVNQALADRLIAFAKAKNTDLPTLATAWVLHKGTHINAIVGMTRPERWRSAMTAAALTLSDDDIKELDTIMRPELVAGRAFPDMRFRDGKIISAAH